MQELSVNQANVRVCVCVYVSVFDCLLARGALGNSIAHKANVQQQQQRRHQTKLKGGPSRSRGSQMEQGGLQSRRAARGRGG